MAAERHIETIKSHLDNIEMMVKAVEWGKEPKDCFAEIQKSVNTIKTRIKFIEEEQ